MFLSAPIGATCGQGMRLRTGLLNPVGGEFGGAVASMPHLRGKTYDQSVRRARSMSASSPALPMTAT